MVLMRGMSDVKGILSELPIGSGEKSCDVLRYKRFEGT